MRTSTFRHLLGTSVGLLLAAATAVACQGSAPDHADAGPQTGSRTGSRATTVTTYFAQYGASTHAYKPRRLNPSVDGSLYVVRMRWPVWDNGRAVGRGVAHVNDCKPYCAAGHYTRYRVTVRLARPRVACGSRFFTSIRVRGSGYHTYARWSGVSCG